MKIDNNKMVSTSPCVRDCPNRAQGCVKTCEALKAYEKEKHEGYKRRQHINYLFDSHEAERVKKNRDKYEKKHRNR